MATIVPAPAGTANIAQNFAVAGGQLGQGIGQFFAQQRQKQQQEAMRQFLQQQGVQLPQGLPPQLLSQLLLNRQQQQAALGLQAARPKTRTVESNIVDPTNPKEIIKVSDTIDAQTGKLLNRRIIGEPTLATKFGGVDPKVLTNLQKPVAAKIQTELKDVEINIANLESILDQFRPEFTEIPFKIGQKV